jgi:SH3-like domain-containing protein
MTATSRSGLVARTDIKLWIGLVALGAAVTVSAEKQADGEAEPLPTMNVHVNEAVARNEPSFLSPVALTLAYGDSVGIVDKTEDWHKVQPASSAVTGWMHVSALTEKKIKLEAGETDENVQASKQELALGGRGFNKDVEDQFRTDNADLDAAYSELDRLTADPAGRSSYAEISKFMREGELTARGGGQ